MAILWVGKPVLEWQNLIHNLKANIYIVLNYFVFGQQNKPLVWRE